jgi:hypothetical protein
LQCPAHTVLSRNDGAFISETSIFHADRVCGPMKLHQRRHDSCSTKQRVITHTRFEIDPSRCRQQLAFALQQTQESMLAFQALDDVAAQALRRRYQDNNAPATRAVLSAEHQLLPSNVQILEKIVRRRHIRSAGDLCERSSRSALCAANRSRRPAPPTAPARSTFPKRRAPLRHRLHSSPKKYCYHFLTTNCPKKPSCGAAKRFAAAMTTTTTISATRGESDGRGERTVKPATPSIVRNRNQQFPGPPLICSASCKDCKRAVASNRRRPAAAADRRPEGQNATRDVARIRQEEAIVGPRRSGEW